MHEIDDNLLVPAIRKVTEEKFDKLVERRDLDFNFVTYSSLDGGYVACYHYMSSGNNETSEVFDTIEEAIQWLLDFDV